MTSNIEKRIVRLEKRKAKREAEAMESVLRKIRQRNLVTTRDARLLREAFPITKQSDDSGGRWVGSWWRKNAEREFVQARVWEIETLLTRLISTVATVGESRLLLVDGLFVIP